MCFALSTPVFLTICYARYILHFRKKATTFWPWLELSLASNFSFSVRGNVMPCAFYAVRGPDFVREYPQGVRGKRTVNGIESQVLISLTVEDYGRMDKQIYCVGCSSPAGRTPRGLGAGVVALHSRCHSFSSNSRNENRDKHYRVNILTNNNRNTLCLVQYQPLSTETITGKNPT